LSCKSQALQRFLRPISRKVALDLPHQNHASRFHLVCSSGQGPPQERVGFSQPRRSSVYLLALFLAAAGGNMKKLEFADPPMMAMWTGLAIGLGLVVDKIFFLVAAIIALVRPIGWLINRHRQAEERSTPQRRHA
jgi:hypothetical protein